MTIRYLTDQELATADPKAIQREPLVFITYTTFIFPKVDVPGRRGNPTGRMADPHVFGFPRFPDGDVLIVLSGSRQYVLHSAVLRNVSPTLSELLQEQYTAKLRKPAVKRQAPRFRLQLRGVSGNVQEDSLEKYKLDRVELDADGKPVDGKAAPLDLENGKSVGPKFVAYHAVFRALYTKDMDMGDFHTDSLEDLLDGMMRITQVAEYLQCIEVITPKIEATLLPTGQILQKSIACKPIAWLEYGFRVRSRALFAQALIHAVGQYAMGDTQEQLTLLDPAVVVLIKTKAFKLQNAVKDAFKKILTYYPRFIQREKTIGPADKDTIGRASYGNDIFDWMALTVLRHWVSYQVACDETHNAPDLGKSVIDVIHRGGNAYLTKHELNNFHTFFPMSGKGCKVIEAKVAALKEDIKQWITPFTKNESQLDTCTTKIDHLTCATVGPNDYPWAAGFKEATSSLEIGSDEDEEKGVGA